MNGEDAMMIATALNQLNATMDKLNRTLDHNHMVLTRLVHDENNHAAIVIANVEQIQERLDRLPATVAGLLPKGEGGT